MVIFQGSSRDLMWKHHIRGPTMVWGRAKPPGETAGGLKKRKKPKRKQWAGAIKSVRSTGRLTSVMKWTKTSPGAPRPTLLLALSKPSGLTGPSTIHHITTGQEKTNQPKRAGGASIRKRGAMWRTTAMITYFLLSRGKKSLSSETASDSTFSVCLVSMSTTFWQCFYYLWLNKEVFVFVFYLSHI